MGTMWKGVVVALVLLASGACTSPEDAHSRLVECMQTMERSKSCDTDLISVWVDNNDDEAVTSALNEYNRCTHGRPLEDCSEARSAALAALSS